MAPHVPSGSNARITYFPGRVSGPTNLGRISLWVRVLGRTTASLGKVDIHHISDVTLFRKLCNEKFCSVRIFAPHHQHPRNICRGGHFRDRISGQKVWVRTVEERLTEQLTRGGSSTVRFSSDKRHDGCPLFGFHHLHPRANLPGRPVFRTTIPLFMLT